MLLLLPLLLLPLFELEENRGRRQPGVGKGHTYFPRRHLYYQWSLPHHLSLIICLSFIIIGLLALHLVCGCKGKQECGSAAGSLLPSPMFGNKGEGREGEGAGPGHVAGGFVSGSHCFETSPSFLREQGKSLPPPREGNAFHPNNDTSPHTHFCCLLSASSLHHFHITEGPAAF